MTQGNERRKKILALLEDASEPINATKIGELLSVTRQIIVADIALLRASGVKIRALHRGYVLDKSGEGVKRFVMCKHDVDGTRDEFYAVVDNGATVLDVRVEHPLYSTICAELNISSRYDADKFIERAEAGGAKQLSSLTDGVHIHTIAAKDEEALDRVTDRLRELGILVDNT